MLLVLLDLSAAFDTVNHDLLIHRLEEVSGITGGVLAWMQSYLTGRTQSVVIDGTSSAPHSLSVGLPQTDGASGKPPMLPSLPVSLVRRVRSFPRLQIVPLWDVATSRS